MSASQEAPRIPVGQTDTHLATVPWIEVCDSRGVGQVLGLREVLLRAHEFADLASEHPIEHAGLLRFLANVAALVVREEGPQWTARDAGQFSETAVDAALARVLHALDPADQRDPFMQDPAPTLEAMENAPPATTLAFERPGSQSRAWHYWQAIGEPADGQVSWPRLANMLVGFWHSSPTNNARLDGASSPKQEWSPFAGKPGRNAWAFWVGPNLFETVLAATPRAWVADNEDRAFMDLPCWADRDGTRSGADLRSLAAGTTPLWWGSFSPNTVCVRADERTGLPSQVKAGGTLRFDSSGMKRDDLRDILLGSDHHYLPTFTKRWRGPQPQAGLATMPALVSWYRSAAAEEQQEHMGVAVIRPRPVSGWRPALLFTELTIGATPKTVAMSWITAPASEANLWYLEDEPGQWLATFGEDVERYAECLRLKFRQGRGPGRGGPLEELHIDTGWGWDDPRKDFYRRSSAVCVRFALEATASGSSLVAVVPPGMRRDLEDAAVLAFDRAVEPARDTSMWPAVLRVRHDLLLDVAALRDPVTKAGDGHIHRRSRSTKESE